VAALPGDHALRLDLARARMQAGQAEAGRAALLGLATDAAVPTDVRVDAADALRRASAFPEAAKAYDALFDAATGEDERQQLSEKAFWARFWSGDHGHALDDLVRMRLAGRKLQAERLFVAAAERLRFDREAGAQADLLRAADGHDAESLRAAHRAHSRLGQWHKALEDLADLARLDPDRAADLAIDRGTALVALGKTAEAAEIAKRALAGPSPGSRAWRLQLELARAASDKPGIETALREVLGRSPGDMEARLAAARALAGLGDLDGAASILTATPFKGPDREGTIVAAAILVAAQNPRGAAVLLDAAPDRGGPVAEVRALVAVLVDAEPAASARLAAMLRGLAKQNLEAASSAVDAMAAPAALKEQWKAILLAVQGRPEQASAAAADLARARIFAESRVFADKADVILRLLAEKAGPRARTFDLVRAWWKLEAANPKAAADVAVPMLEPRGATPMVSLVAALAAADLSGESSAIKVLDGAPEPVSDVFLSDVAHGLAARGMHAGALRAATKLATPGDRDRALLFLLAVERRDGKEARRLLKTVPDGWWSRPTIRAAATWTALQNDATKAAGEAELEAIATDPRELARVDALVLYEAALLSGKSAIASTILAHAQRSVRFDPAGIQRFVEVLRRLQADKPALQTLEERLRVVDPSGKLRVAAGRPVRVD
jgi:tetratricopeptide (TPR) repeat protein